MWTENSAKYSLGEMFQGDGTDLRDFELNETRARRHPLLQLVPFRVAGMDQSGKDGE